MKFDTDHYGPNVAKCVYQVKGTSYTYMHAYIIGLYIFYFT